MSEATLPEQIRAHAMGRPDRRRDARLKVTGRATYAVEHETDDTLQAHLVLSTVAKGRIRQIHADEVRELPGVVDVVDHTNAPRVASDADPELAILQDDRVHYRGQVVAVVLAETAEQARAAAQQLRVDYDEEPARTEFDADSEGYEPDSVNAGYETATDKGEVDAALRTAAVVVDETYRTPYEHQMPMEPHATLGRWRGEGETDEDQPTLWLYDSTQGVHPAASTVAELMGLDAADVRVTAPYVGGGFGSKGLPHPQVATVALAAKKHAGRWVRLPVTRQQMFTVTGYRTATVQHVRLGADSDGRLTAVDHRVLEQTSAIKEYGEQTAEVTRHVYATPNLRTAHRLVELDVSVPTWMRAPGVMPGMVGLEIAMDELAERCGIDPIELRRRNEPEVDPESGKPFGHRRLMECFDRGAREFGWEQRASEPRQTLEGDWWVGLGVATSTYPAHPAPGNTATVRSEPGERYTVAIGAADIGTGAWTVLAQIAADALEVDADRVEMRIGDTRDPKATVAGGPTGTSGWGSAIVAAALAFRKEHGDTPPPGLEATADAARNPAYKTFSLHSFGAQFAEVRVNRWTGEIRVPRMLGVFSAGRIVNPRLARSQLIGGMTMGIGAALFEESVRDPRFGHFVTQDLASYHVPAHADIRDVEAVWLDDVDPRANPMGLRGVGEIGIVGATAAVVNAIHHATGVRARSVPVTADELLPRS
ncbi:xanthine dehydrogenase YagR molybdenum-binding subunit [Barrientosiimonas humi]|uniref:Xanthine dehydrogenase YagR molybdenum-binding subunit n=2 Tax=Barrientosiimonas TaxID=1535207 RepID=A0A542X9I1_9MICO|nr:xanthine dehydrogenase family protein molybdopterin-binding subunit [Barrientosiimonas humi]TQL32493.1 xanthine dehydrogenase YagR molybdenum-binding subunit [Barrientosiimonas humi]CAG7572485.1 Xanthine dehydrogenase molybdenum-binding subunit [Barrientosiimonas humi]